MMFAAAVTMHLMMVDCPAGHPKSDDCDYALFIDFRGPEKDASQLCQLNSGIINPNIIGTPGRQFSTQCWTPKKLENAKLKM